MKKQAVRRTERQFGIFQIMVILMGVAVSLLAIDAFVGIDRTPDGHITAAFVDESQRDVIDAQMQCQGGLLRRYATGAFTKQRLAEALDDVAAEDFASCN